MTGLSSVWLVGVAGATEMTLLYSPPYSPELHPIERIISKVKRLLGTWRHE